MFGLAIGGAALGCSRPNRRATPTPSVSASASGQGLEVPPPDEEVIITSLANVPGRATGQPKGGLFCRFFESGTGDYAERFRNALEGIRVEGKKLGANAFVQASVSSESHEIQGSKWHSSIVHICGDFVRLD